MRLYAAIDLHSTNCMVVILDERDNTILEKRCPNALNVVLGELAPYRADIAAVAVESTYNWYWLVDGLMAAGYKAELVNTSEVKVYDGMKYTGDEHDARHLAHLLRLGLLPTGYIYPREERAVRDLLRKRMQLVQSRTAQILSMENLVSRNTGKGIRSRELRGLDKAGLLERSGGSEVVALALGSNLAVIKCLDEQIAGLERAVLARARMKPEFRRLLTADGIGEILGMTIMYEAGDMGRFEKVGCFASYARCVSSSKWSNGKKKGEGNRKNGNRYLAWAFVEAAHGAIRFNERVKRFYQRKKAKKNVAVAMKAVAHKLARACYHMLKNGTDFDAGKAFA